MIFRTKSNINLIKLYFSPRSEDDSVDLRKILDICEISSSAPGSRFSVNYGEDRDVSTYVDSLSYKNLEYLTVIDERGQLLLAVGQAFRSVGRKTMFECTVVRSHDDTFNKETKIFNAFSSAFNLYYGYGRVLREDYFPTTETKIKKTLFGNVTVDVRKPEAGWMFNPHDIREGAVKGIYPINFWSEPALKKMIGDGVNLPDSMKGRENIYFFDIDERRRLISTSAKHSQFFHFGET